MCSRPWSRFLEPSSCMNGALTTTDCSTITDIFRLPHKQCPRGNATYLADLIGAPYCAPCFPVALCPVFPLHSLIVGLLSFASGPTLPESQLHLKMRDQGAGGRFMSANAPNIGDVEAATKASPAQMPTSSRALPPTPPISRTSSAETRSLEPPVTKATMSELDVSKIIHNPKLRHDVNFDPELHFPPDVDGERGH